METRVEMSLQIFNKVIGNEALFELQPFFSGLQRCARTR